MAMFDNKILLRCNKSELKLSEGMMIVLKELSFKTAFLKRYIYLLYFF